MPGRRHGNHLRADSRVGSAVQAHTIEGGVHYYDSPPRHHVVPRQLPAAPGRLVARDHELRVLDRTVGGQSRVVAVEGPGGVGKTSLVLHWLHRNVNRFPDGELYADLRGFDPTGTPNSAGAVLHAFLLGLGVAPEAVPTDVDARGALYRTLVAGKRIAVVLDNAADTDQVTALLPGSETCRTVVTSRNHLTGLAMSGAEVVSLDMMPDSDARKLLARSLGEQPLGEEPEAVATILASCCGLPLALAIVAARTSRHLGLGVIATELRDSATRLDALDTGERASNLRAVISWSVSALDDRLSDVFSRLGIAPTSTITAAAAASLTALPPAAVGAALRELERKNLLHQRMSGRFGMHDLVRLYAKELAMHDHPAAERDRTLRRLVDFYLHSAFAGDRKLYPHRAPVRLDPPQPGCHPLDFAGETDALDWFAAEHANLVAAQQAAMERRWYREVWLLSRALDTFHYRQGLVADNVTCSRLGTVAVEHLADPSALVLAYRQLGRAHTFADELPDAVTCLQRALSLATSDNERGHCRHDLARALTRQHQFAAAVTHLEAAIESYVLAANPVGEAHARNALGRCHLELGDLDTARSLCEQALALHERHGNRSGQAVTLDNLATVAARTDHRAEAISLYRRAIATCQDISNIYFEAACTERLGSALAADHQTAGARDAWRSALSRYTTQHRLADADRVHRLLTTLDTRPG
ncbi:tetratricopeptide repeat protein [Kutzneria buriramensis]|uniref:Tetratricopeptide repeat protein n=1 Tax=Kutzneria buriramensis TaxID=1045776 RepID=A0A3E0H2G2_9PSEU|nr:tetratricopeptide repeat protein [Kutzneria buriramensis]REH37056.1 tetratricopeptide repeat protein [Kutzneria buriramensis]